jgi:Ca-activated chloride channel homolog
MWLTVPQWLWGLGTALLVAGIFLAGWRRQQALRHALGEPALLQALSQPASRPMKAGEVAFAALTALFTVLALAPPQTETPPLDAAGRGVDLIAAIDVSKSMAAEDYGALSRLDKGKEALMRLLHHLPSETRVGLVTFAGTSFQQADLTGDVAALRFILEHWVKVESVPVGGSALSHALETALGAFEGNDRRKWLLFLSDGGDWEDGLVPVTQKAQQQGVTIIGLGLGGMVPARIPRYNRDGVFEGYERQGDETLTTALNERTLRYMAQTTGGQYLRIHSGKELVHLLRSPPAAATAWQRGKLFQGFLLLALLSLAATIVCEHGRLAPPTAALARAAARLKGCTSNWLAGRV